MKTVQGHSTKPNSIGTCEESPSTMRLPLEDSHAIQEVRTLFTKDSQKIVFIAGNFNVIHPGHLRLLLFAKECGDRVVVGILPDRNQGVLIPADLRLKSIQSLTLVDYAFVLHGDKDVFISQLQPDFVIKGGEFRNQENSEEKILAEFGGKLLFHTGGAAFSSQDLISSELSPKKSVFLKPREEFLERHDISYQTLAQTIKDFSNLTVAVIGDTILDQYISCFPEGMSQEDPTIVVVPNQSNRFIGGAAVVASHARGLGSKVHFLSVVGKDSEGKYVEEALSEKGVVARLFEDESRPTSLKTRYRAKDKTLLRVNNLRKHQIHPSIASQMYKAIEDIVDHLDVLIFSDFNYGCLPQSLVDSIKKLCESRGVMMVADSQSSSQVGDISRFKGMDVVTPTEREARLALKDFDSGLAMVAQNLMIQMGAKNVVVTLAEDGLLLESGEKDQWCTDRLAAFNNNAKDPSGAGDSLLVVLAMARALGSSLEQSAFLGNLAAACQVDCVGSVSLTRSDLLAQIEAVSNVP